MKAAFYTETGAPEVLQYGDVEDPTCGPADVVIKVSAISIEGGDLLHRRITPVDGARRIGGYQAAGTVTMVGPEVKSLRPGDSVVGFNFSCSHAELFAVPQHFAYPVPAGTDLKAMSTVPVAFGTAHQALFEYGQLRSGETLLIHGASGGVGIALVQIAKRAGARVIGTASSPEKIAALKTLGLDIGIDGRTGDIRAETLAATRGYGVDLAIDLVGGPKFSDLFAAIRPRGRLVMVGMASGVQPTLDPAAIRQSAVTVTGFIFGKVMHLPEIGQMISGLLSDVAAGELVMPVEKTFRLSEAAAAHRHVEDNRPFGKVVLIP
ncbi:MULTISPECIES: quinone oxidoreductase family protein [Maritimibacter]|jgi:NADPH:quinone reductase-like Zn-dependent oxidoreductase|uniref:quinone oxidoreductase family protein n=1 Tax=Maritimibacter TaxID=404235 RepID=UPI000C0A841C|nr:MULTISPECIES: zinc-binding dehydrogenase [Maritimibacter]MAM61366.1 alcohol dehydrogenase [Maritimibacter sp.]MBL6430138.1 zinc-binding dehydrogenase [Maritimibacter sp.]|tara:strand:+ start:5244 stop:6206 length:963 start_codon:yes stop_codon:yes gene_type:complete